MKMGLAHFFAITILFSFWFSGSSYSADNGMLDKIRSLERQLESLAKTNKNQDAELKALKRDMNKKLLDAKKDYTSRDEGLEKSIVLNSKIRIQLVSDVADIKQQTKYTIVPKTNRHNADSGASACPTGFTNRGQIQMKAHNGWRAKHAAGTLFDDRSRPDWPFWHGWLCLRKN